MEHGDTMFKTIIERWKEAVFIFGIVALAFNFYGWKVEAGEQQKKSEQYEEAFKDIAQIAKDLTDPNKPLRDYLILHNINKDVARDWSAKPKDPVKDSTGAFLPISFLDKELLPEIGVEMKPADSGFKVLDTLWNFKK